MTLSARFVVTAVRQSVFHETATTVVCQFESDAGPSEALVGGEVLLEIVPGHGLDLPSEGDIFSLNGWFANRFGEATSDEPATDPSQEPIRSTDP